MYLKIDRCLNDVSCSSMFIDVKFLTAFGKFEARYENLWVR